MGAPRVPCRRLWSRRRSSRACGGSPRSRRSSRPSLGRRGTGWPRNLGKYRDELKAVNIRVRNAKSQFARTKNPDPDREAALRETVAAGEARAEELRRAVERGERLRFDEQMVCQRMASFDDVWRTLTIEEQARVLRQLIERVGYDARGDKVKVTYHSNGIREFCKEATK
jgi:hypothetical protein